MLRKLYNNSKELFIVDTVIGYLSSQHVLPQYFLCNILEFSASGSLALYREQDIGVELPRRNITVRFRTQGVNIPHYFGCPEEQGRGEVPGSIPRNQWQKKPETPFSGYWLQVTKQNK